MLATSSLEVELGGPWFARAGGALGAIGYAAEDRSKVAWRAELGLVHHAGHRDVLVGASYGRSGCCEDGTTAVMTLALRLNTIGE